jgi:hypothetical protein
MHVVHKTVAIVVDKIGPLIPSQSVASIFARINPHVGGEIFVGVADSGIDDGNNEVGAEFRMSQAPGA